VKRVVLSKIKIHLERRGERVDSYICVKISAAQRLKMKKKRIPQEMKKRNPAIVSSDGKDTLAGMTRVTSNKRAGWRFRTGGKRMEVEFLGKNIGESDIK